MAKPKNIKHRDGFTFFKSYDDVMQNLNDKQFLLLMRTILDVQFLRVKYEKVKFNDNILDLLWSSMKYNISSQVDGYLANFSKNNNQFMGVYKESNDPLDGEGNDPWQEEQEQEQEQEKVKEKEEEKVVVFSFSLTRETSYENLSLEYREKLKEEIEKLNLSLSFIDFVDSLVAKGYKYKNFLMAYKTWCKKDFNTSKKTTNNSFGGWSE